MKDYKKYTILMVLIIPVFFYFYLNEEVTNGQAYTTSVIQDVTIVAVNENKLIAHQDVVVSDGKIVEIIDTKQSVLKPDFKIISGKGKFLMPGLAEMHAHIPGSNQGQERIAEVLFLYLANGVTTIRGMLGQPYHLELREKVQKGEILGPRIFTSGPSLNGNSVKTLAEAEKKVKAQKIAGYDFLKLHPGLTRENFDQIVKTATEVGIPYSGHVSVDVGIRRAIEAKYASIDHVDGYLEGLVPAAAEVVPDANGFFGINFTKLADQRNIEALAKATKEAGVWVVPTQCLMERWAGKVNPDAIIKENGMQYMPKNTLGQWVSSKRNFDRLYQLDEKTSSLFIEIRRNIIKSLHEHGVGLLLGSDSPQVFNVPGFSIHLELKAMVNAGLAPHEALTSGSSNPARFFNMSNTFGEIRKGASADFLLLNQNPLEDVAYVQNKSGVMVRGQWLDKAEIGQRLKVIEEKYK